MSRPCSTPGPHGSAAGPDRLDVLLIHPPFERLMGLMVNMFPVSLGPMATLLKQSGLEVRIYNGELGRGRRTAPYTPRGRAEAFARLSEAIHDTGHEVWSEISSVIAGYHPRIVGITSYSSTHTIALKIARLVKQISASTVVLGGPFPTLCPERAASDPDVDYVVVGEGEHALLELCQSLLNRAGQPDQIAGLVYRDGDRLITTAKRERITDLDSLPLLDHELVHDLESHKATVLSTIIGSRGCPHACSFCASVPLWGRKVYYRSPASLVAEIERNERVLGLSSGRFRFFDDTFTSSSRRTIELCDRLCERGLHRRLQWSCLTRVDTISEPLLRALERASCTQVSLGIESGSDRILKTLNKGITTRQVRESAALVHRSRLRLNLFFMVGTPHETEQDLAATRDLMLELKPDTVNLQTFTPYPGTRLWDTCVERGLIRANEHETLYEHAGHHNIGNYFCTEIPKERYDALLADLLSLTDTIRRRPTGKKARAWLHEQRFRLRRAVAGRP